MGMWLYREHIHNLQLQRCRTIDKEIVEDDHSVQILLAARADSFQEVTG